MWGFSDRQSLTVTLSSADTTQRNLCMAYLSFLRCVQHLPPHFNTWLWVWKVHIDFSPLLPITGLRASGTLESPLKSLRVTRCLARAPAAWEWGGQMLLLHQFPCLTWGDRLGFLTPSWAVSVFTNSFIQKSFHTNNGFTPGFLQIPNSRCSNPSDKMLSCFWESVHVLLYL
jgi:hypothetical protein